MLPEKLSNEQFEEFTEIGYVKLGQIDEKELRKLQCEIDAIMLGKAGVDYDAMLMQIDPASGLHKDASLQTKGFKGATLNYRKIQDLERDPVFLEYLRHALFEEIAQKVYGQDVPVGLFRTMFMNKPANKGTFLPWHQDRFSSLDRDPQITIWTAMDPATKENGCVQVIPGSHRHGLINPTDPNCFLSKAQSAAICTPDRIVFVELEPGEVVLLHNYLLHASDVNRSPQSRRALSVCYMDGRTLDNGEPFDWPLAFGALAAER